MTGQGNEAGDYVARKGARGGATWCPPPLWGRVREGALTAEGATRPSSRRRPRVPQKFGSVTGVNGNKLTIHFDKAGEKRVVDSFVERV